MSAQQRPTASELPSRTRWLLLALLAADRHTLTPVQLQKVLFVLQQRRPHAVGQDFYSFQPYHYGPFDATVYSDAEWLASQGLLSIDASGGRSFRTYSLTPEGVAVAREVATSADAAGREYLDKLVPWAQRLSFSALVRAIYEDFPEMRENSVFQDQA